MYSYVRVYVYMSCVSIHQSSSRRKLAYVLLFLRVFVCPCVCVYVVGEYTSVFIPPQAYLYASIPVCIRMSVCICICICRG